MLFLLIFSSNSSYILAAMQAPPQVVIPVSDWTQTRFDAESIKMASCLDAIWDADFISLKIVKDPTSSGLSATWLAVNDNQLIGKKTTPKDKKTQFVVLRNKKGELGFYSNFSKKNIMSADASARYPRAPYKVTVEGGSFFGAGTWEPWIVKEDEDGFALFNKNAGGYLVVCRDGSWTNKFDRPNTDINNATIFNVYKNVYKKEESPKAVITTAESPAENPTPSQLAEFTTPAQTPTTAKTQTPKTLSWSLNRLKEREQEIPPFKALDELEAKSSVCKFLLTETEAAGNLRLFLCKEGKASPDPKSYIGKIENLNPRIRIIDHNKLFAFLHEVTNKMLAAQKDDAAAEEKILLDEYGRPQQYFPAMIKKMENNSRVAVIGDLHGNIEALFAIIADLDANNFFQKDTETPLLLNPNCHIKFLGDYVDRGVNGVIAIFIAGQLWMYNQKNVSLCRGNHEMKSMYNAYGLAQEFEHRNISAAGEEIFTCFLNALPYTIMLAFAKQEYSGLASGYNLIQLCHGGLGKMFSHPNQPIWGPDPDNEDRLREYFKNSLFTWDGVHEGLSSDTNIFELFEQKYYSNEQSLIPLLLKNHFTQDGNDCRSLAIAWNDYASTEYEQHIFARYMASNRRTNISPKEAHDYFNIAQSKLRDIDTFCGIIRAHNHTCYPWALFAGDEAPDRLEPWVNPGNHVEFNREPKIISIISSKKTTAQGNTKPEQIRARFEIPGEHAAYTIIESSRDGGLTANLRLLQ